VTRYALISGGLVATVVEQATPPNVPGFVAVELADGSRVGPGWIWDGSVLIAPASTASLTLRDFWRRFTVAEREALQGILATGTQIQRNKLNAFRDYLAAGGNVELADDYVISSLVAMESAGIIAAGRASQILTP
jgi:hypothetical protein